MSPTNELIETISITENTELGAYAYLVGRFIHLPSRKALKKAIKAGRLIDLSTGLPLGELSKLSEGMSIGLRAIQTLPPVWEYPLQVVYEDEDVAVVFKPSGMTTSSTKLKCVKHALPFNLRSTTRNDGLNAPMPVHRLDHATEGLLLCAKTASALVDLGRQFESRRIVKRYIAHVSGPYTGPMFLDHPIAGKTAHTRILNVTHRTNRKGEIDSQLVLEPLHGRTHQLRIHLSTAGHPIIGDHMYGSGQRGKLRLKSASIGFAHPVYRTILTVSLM